MERVPKQRGFTSRMPKAAEVNVRDLERLFSSGATVGPREFTAQGLMQPTDKSVKVLGSGTLTKKLTVYAHGFSKGAEKVIKDAGGAVIRLGPVSVQQETRANKAA